MSYSYKIPKFRPDQSPRDWLNAFNTGCKILKVKDEEKLDYVPGYLNKSVSRWFYDHDFESYQQFEKEFEDRFTVEKKLSTKTLLNKILNIKKKHNETIREYNDRFDHMTRKLEKKTQGSKLGEEELKDAYIAGLRPVDIRKFVKRANPSSLKSAKNLTKEEEDRNAESEDSDSGSDEDTDSSSSSPSDDDSSDEESTSRRKTDLKEMKSRNNQSSRRKTIKSTESNHKSNKTKDNGKMNTQTSVDEVTSLMKNLTLLIQTQNNQQQSFLNQQPASKQMNQNGFSPKLCYNCQGEGHLARDCRPCKYCKGREGDHSFWECKLYPRRQTQVAQGGANSYLVFPGNHANENEENKQANFEVYSAEKRPYSGSERDVGVTRSGKKVKVRNPRKPAKEHKITNQSNHAFKSIVEERTPDVNDAPKQYEVSVKDESSMLPGETIEINDLKKAKVFTVSMEQLANSIKGFKTKLTKELRTPQKNPRSKVMKGAKVTSYYNSGPRNNVSKVRYYVEDPKKRRGAPRVATIVAGMVEVPAVLDQGSHGTIMSVRLCDALGIDLNQAKPSKTRHTLADGSVASALKDLDEIMVQVQGVPVVIPCVSVLQHPAYDLLLGEDALDVLEIVTDHKRKHWTIRTDNGVEPLETIWDHTNYIHKLEADENYSGDDESDIENYSGYSDEDSSDEYQQRESYLMMPLMPDGTNTPSNIEPQGSIAVESFLHERNQSNNMQGSNEEDICEAVEQSVERCEINEDQKKVLLKLLMKYKQVFGLDYKDLKQTNLLKLSIDTGSEKPIYRKPNRFMSHSELDALKAEIEEMIANGQIIPTPGGASSGWAFPVLYVKKKTGEKRLCVQFQDLNSITVQDAWPLPHIIDLLESYKGSKIFSTLDLLKGFNQIAVDDDTIPKLTMSTPWGLFSYCVMPFGIKSGPAVFCRMIYLAMEKFLGKGVSTYIDDICVHNTSFEEHLSLLEQVLRRLHEVNLVLKPNKCVWCQRKVEVLGFIVSPTGITPNPKNVEKIINFKRPHNVKDIRAFTALAGFYRRHIQGFGEVIEPLNRLLKKNTRFVWGHEHQVAYESIKNSIVKAVELKYPDPYARYSLYTDASDIGLGAVLTQMDNELGEERPICFLSRKLVPAEVNYPTVEKELLAVVYALKKLRKYLLDKAFDLYTDNTAVRYLFKKNDISQRLQRWILCVQEFSFQVHHLPGKNNVVADVMSRYPPVQNESSEEEDPFHNMYPALLVELNERDQYESELMKLRAYLVNPHAESETEANDAKLRKKAVNYRLDEQLNLYRLFRNERMVLIPKIDDRQDILMQVHNGHGHYGQEATWSRLYKQYWWPTAYEEVKEYVRSCHECQMFSNVPSKVALHGNVPVNHLFERFAIDYIGPFPMTKKKNKYILLAVECYSRWPVAKAVKYANSTTTVDFMYNELFTVFGASKFLLSDNGLHFTGNEVEEFAKRLKIKHQYTSPYHPQTNGMVESINGVIVKSLKKTALEHNEDWDTLLPTVLYAYRTKAHSILKLSPYELLFGVEPLGVDKDVLQEYGRKIGFERLSYLQQRNGLQNFMVDYQPQVEAHDQESKINVGGQVLLLKHHRKNKMDIKYRKKLYTVLVKKVNNVFILANDKGIRLKRSVNGSQIKKYYSRDH